MSRQGSNKDNRKIGENWLLPIYTQNFIVQKIGQYAWRTKTHLNLLLTCKLIHGYLSSPYFFHPFFEDGSDKPFLMNCKYSLKSTEFGVQVGIMMDPIIPTDPYSRLLGKHRCKSVCLYNDLKETHFVEPPKWIILRLFDGKELIESLKRVHGDKIDTSKINVAKFVRRAENHEIIEQNHSYFQLKLKSLDMGSRGRSDGFFFTRKAAEFFLFFHTPSRKEFKEMEIAKLHFEIHEIRELVMKLQGQNQELQEKVERLTKCIISQREIEEFWNMVYYDLENNTNLLDECSVYVEFISYILENGHPLVRKVKKVFFVQYDLSAIKILESLGYRINPRKYNFMAKINSFLFHVHGGVRVVGYLHNLGNAASESIYTSLSKKANRLHELVRNYLLSNWEKLDLLVVGDNFNVDEFQGYVKRSSRQTLVQILKLIGGTVPDDENIIFNTRSELREPIHTPEWNPRMNVLFDNLTEIYKKKDWLLFQDRKEEEISFGDNVDMDKYIESYSMGNIFPLSIEDNNCKDAGATWEKMIELLKLLKIKNPRFYELVLREAGDYDFHRFLAFMKKLCFKIFQSELLQNLHSINKDDCRVILNIINVFDIHHCLDSFFESSISLRKSKRKKKEKDPKRRKSLQRNKLMRDDDDDSDSETDEEEEEPKKDTEEEERKKKLNSCGRIFEVWNYFHEEISNGRYNITTSMERRFYQDFDWMMGMYQAARTHRDEYMQMMGMTEEILKEEIEIKYNNSGKAPHFIDDNAEFKSMCYFLFEMIPVIVEFLPNLLNCNKHDLWKILEAHNRLEGALIGINSTNYQKANTNQMNDLCNLYDRDRPKAMDMFGRFPNFNSMVIELLFGTLTNQVKNNQCKDFERVENMLKNLIFCMNGKTVWDVHGLIKKTAYEIDQFFAHEQHYRAADVSIRKWIKDRENNLQLMKSYNKRRRKNDQIHIVVNIQGMKRAKVPVFKKSTGSGHYRTPVEFDKWGYFRSTNHPESVSFLLKKPGFIKKELFEKYIYCKAYDNCEKGLIKAMAQLSKVALAKEKMCEIILPSYFGGKNSGGASKLGKTYKDDEDRVKCLEALGPFIRNNSKQFSPREADDLKKEWNIVDLNFTQMRNMLEYNRGKESKKDQDYFPDKNE